MRKRSVRAVANGRKIWAHFSGHSDTEIHIEIRRTDAEQAAWLPKYEAQERARLDAERGIDAKERKRQDAESAARQDADDARMTPAQWLGRMADLSERVTASVLNSLASGRVKRIRADEHQRLTRLAAQFHHAMRTAEVYTVGAEQLPRLRLVKR